MKYSLSILFILLSWVSFAQEVSFKASAPKAVRQSDRFYFQYEVNSEGTDFKSGDLKDFNVLGGPSQSSNSSISIINGRMTQSRTITYTYVLSPKKTGKLNISPGSIKVGGKEYRSNPVTIEVVQGNQNRTQSNQGSDQSQSGISNDDLFVRIQVNKSSVYKGEPVIATVKLYTRVQLQQLSDVKIPQFNGFWRENIERKENAVEWKKETFNGEIYHSGIISEFVVIPQKSGTLTIDPVDLEVIALQQVRSRSRSRSFFNDPFFDDFFDRTSYQRVSKKLQSNTVKIKAKDTPAGTDLVGDLKFSSSVNKTEVKANESVSLKYTLSGKANLKMVEPFEIDFPADFEVFDPEIDQKVRVSHSGISGTKTIEYLLIPRHAGEFNIPSVELNVFNPYTGKTEKLRSDNYELKVSKGEGGEGYAGANYSKSKEDLNLIGKDIRYIKTGNYDLHKDVSTWFGSLSFYMTYLAGSIGFVVLFISLRKRRQSLEDTVGLKKRKAGAMARKRLKTAEEYKNKQNEAGFYEELLKANWLYIQDKLNMPQADLSKDKIRKKLAEQGVKADTTEKLISLMEKCEMARYAPVATKDGLSSDYENNIEIISNLEEEIK